MMKKCIYWLLCSVVLLALLLLCVKAGIAPSELKFRIEQDSGHVDITVFESGDGKHYVFLPSYTKMSTLKIVMSDSWDASLGGIPISNDMSCENFELETPYALTINNQYVSDLLFFQSANVATMYVDTVTNSLDYIHKDKNYSEMALVTLYTEDGDVTLLGDASSLKGRGNGTWVSNEKRPYLLTLSSYADLLGMGAAKKWVLIANAQDGTNLNNALIMDLARQSGIGWIPEYRYVDLYLNGEYRGLYLLCEKVEAGSSRLNIDINSGDFLCKVEDISRWDGLKNPILSQSGRAIEVTSSSVFDKAYESYVIDSINHLEEIIFSGADLAEVGNFDLDSWVRKYLIDEIAGNVDSDMNSSYFYYSNGVFYGGPVWDYDLAFGNSNLGNQNPNAFVAKNEYKSEHLRAPYYNALYTNESFYNRAVELYQSDFLPLLNQLIDTGIYAQAYEIRSAAAMDALRWSGGRSVAHLMSHLKNKVSFLNSVWIDKTEYCTLQFETERGANYWNISVEKGTLLVTDSLDLKNSTWINIATGEAVDFSQPIMSDMRLKILQAEPEQVQPEQVQPEQVPPEQVEPTITFATRDYITFLSVIVLLILLFYLLRIDILQRKRERRSVNESK